MSAGEVNNKIAETSSNGEALTVTIIGVGLIGGSMALILKEKGFAKHIIGVEANKENAQKALELKIVDEILPLYQAVMKANIIVLAVPVSVCEQLLPQILDNIDSQVVIDTGSTKKGITDAVKNHPKRGRFVATHPMWGTEYSGPQAATRDAFARKATVVCNVAQSDTNAVQMAEDLYKTLGMYIVHMDAEDHDVHVAYVSHISHITSFALANTVLEKEKEEDAIFELASAGFESTVRLAKSNPAMWVPIFMQNRENVLDVLNEHISQLRKFKACLEKENTDYLKELIENANKIRKIIK
ncbi:prephenate dehydrogenase [Ilyomonas limi]|uniref:Prephenate dehydrogenase n=1 Tax=Ilyomonas limi TaxID=2575867 RepID=A0A4U3KT82_9BACT|nr:prephenate dehydrogenase [Ilyomonas limi]TKK64919.1 prephenate dehydrogenase [Ilyomonas limi]